MIIPNSTINYNGDIRFEITHLSEGKKSMKKQVLEREIYKNWIIVNQESHEVLEFECECADFKKRRRSKNQCKHLRKSIKLLQSAIPDLRDLKENPEKKDYNIKKFANIGI